jgi:hypothetical protein
MESQRITEDSDDILVDEEPEKQRSDITLDPLFGQDSDPRDEPTHPAEDEPFVPPPIPARIPEDPLSHVRVDDVAYLVCVNDEEVEDIVEAWKKNVWASTLIRLANDRTPAKKIVGKLGDGRPYKIGGHEKLARKYIKYSEEPATEDKQRVLLVFTSYASSGKRPLYGIARVAGSPDAKLQNAPRWQRPRRFGNNPFPIEWLFKNEPSGIKDRRLVLPLLPDPLCRTRDVAKIKNPDSVYRCVLRCVSFNNAKRELAYMIDSNRSEFEYRTRARAPAGGEDEDLFALPRDPAESLTYRPEEIEIAAARVASNDREDEILTSTVRSIKEFGLAGAKRRKTVDVEYEEDEVVRLNKKLRDEAPVETSAGHAPLFEVRSLAPPMPPADYGNPDLEDLSFCVVDVDYTEMTSLNDEYAGKTFDNLISGNAPVLRLYGVTREGYSVTNMVRGFLPYIYAPVPPEFRKRIKFEGDHARFENDPKLFDQDKPAVRAVCRASRHVTMCELFRDGLNKALCAKLNEGEKRRYPTESLIFRVDLERKQSIDGYKTGLDWFLKITLCTPKLVVRTRDILKSGEFRWADGKIIKPWTYQVYEANIPFALRFMIDIDLMGCSWVTLKKERYIRWSDAKDNDTFSDLEVTSNWIDVIAHAPDDPRWSDPPPIRKVTFDIVRQMEF